MTKIDKYIYSEMALPSLFGISLFTFIFLIDLLVEMMENIIVKNIPIGDVLEMVSYYFPPILEKTIPMGVFLGVMITYGSLSSNSEIIAMESIGIGLKRFMLPAIILGLLTTGFIFLLQEKIIPRSFVNLEQVTKKIAYTKPALKIAEKTFVEDIGDYNIYINEMDNETNQAKNLIVFKKDLQSNYPQIIIAKTANWKNNSMILEKAKFFNIDNKGEKERAGSFEKQIIPIETFMGDIKLDKTKRQMMPPTRLWQEIKNRRLKGQNILPYEIEFHQKIVTGFSAFILCFLAVMLSVKNNRAGKGVSFGISLVIIFVYIMGINLMKLLTIKGVMNAFTNLWIPNIILMLVSSILFFNQIRRR